MRDSTYSAGGRRRREYVRDGRDHRPEGALGDGQRAAGNSETFKLKSADKLKGVKVGDVVDLSYTDAVAIKVEKAAKK